MPETLALLARQAGFREVETRFLNAPEPAEGADPRLNEILFAPLDYAVVARTMRIAVCSPQVPFARGGAEILAERLTEELRARGHEADLVTLPFKWYPAERVLTQAFLWRLLDLTRWTGGRSTS